jgi:hypothetical protein
MLEYQASPRFGSAAVNSGQAASPLPEATLAAAPKTIVMRPAQARCRSSFSAEKLHPWSRFPGLTATACSPYFSAIAPI